LQRSKIFQQSAAESISSISSGIPTDKKLGTSTVISNATEEVCMRKKLTSNSVKHLMQLLVALLNQTK